MDEDFSFDDLNFDDTSDFGQSGFDSNNSSQDSNNQSNQNNQDLYSGGDDLVVDQSSDINGRNETKKLSIRNIIIGLVILIVVFGIVNLIRGLSNNKNSTSQKPSKTQVVNQNNNGNNQIATNNSDGWLVFEEDPNNISIQDNYIDSQFSITSIKHYVKILDNNNLELKTVLNGALSGFTGTYEISVPYSVGSKLSLGQTFSVQVKMGQYSNNKVIIDEIKY